MLFEFSRAYRFHLSKEDGREGIRHNGITETTLILIHQNGLTATMSQIVFQVTAEIRWGKVNFDALLGIVLLNKLQGRHKVGEAVK